MHKHLKWVVEWFMNKKVLMFVLIFSVMLISVIMYRFALHNSWLQHEFSNQAKTAELSKNLTLLTLYIKDAESSVNDFASSGDKNYVKHFEENINAIKLLYIKIKDLQNRGSNKQNASLFLRADSLIKQKIAMMQQAKAMCDTDNLQGGAALLNQYHITHLTDSFALINKQISDNITDDLKRSQSGFLKVSNSNNLLAYAGVGGSMLVLLIVFFLLFTLMGKLEQMNAALNYRVAKRTKELQLANSELESFTYSVSHDLRAPLRAVNSYAQILEEDHGDKLDEDGKKIVESIKYNGRKMGNLIDELLQFSKLGRKELNRSRVDMNELTKKVLEDFAQANPMHARVSVSPLPEVMADYSLLYQVMYNLVSNAVKYSSKKDNPIIEIFSEEKADKIIFVVKDNGAGFDMRFSNKLFDVFQRLHSEKEFEGNGVGLAIVYRIIKKFGGDITAEGKVDEGAVFRFSLN